MVEDIRFSFIERVNTLEWMDDETRAATLLKANNMRVNIAFPQLILTQGGVEEYYQGVGFFLFFFCFFWLELILAGVRGGPVLQQHGGGGATADEEHVQRPPRSQCQRNVSKNGWKIAFLFAVWVKIEDAW